MAFSRVLNCQIGSITIQNLRIDFEIKKSNREKTKEENICTLKIYNLAPSTRKLISKLDQLVLVNGGYIDSTPSPIFIGTLKDYNEVKTKTDIISEITVKDAGGLPGEESIYSLKTPLFFSPGFTATGIIAAIAALTNTPLGSPITKELIYLGGFSFIGFVKKALDKVVYDGIKQTWYVDDAKLFVVEKDAPIFGVPWIVTNLTGLIGSPEESSEEIKDQKKRKDKDKKFIDMVSFKTLLQPRAVVGQMVSLTSIKVNGDYKITDFKHYGSNYSNDFYTECRGEKV